MPASGKAARSSGIAQRRAAAKVGASEQYVARRQEMVKAAAEVFRDQGLSGTSIDDIAKVAGVDRASLYYYFSSKQELFEAVVHGALVKNIEMAEQICDSDAAPAEKLHELIRNLMESYSENYPHLYAYIREDPSRLRSVANLGSDDVAQLQRRFDRALVSMIQEGMSDGSFRKDISPPVAAYGIIGMANWSHRWFTPDGPIGADEVGDAFSSIARDGLRTPDPV